MPVPRIATVRQLPPFRLACRVSLRRLCGGAGSGVLRIEWQPQLQAGDKISKLPVEGRS
jgi:hypothetical protein